MRDTTGGLHAEDGAQAFASSKGGVAHGAVNGMRLNGGGRQQTFESVVSERGASFQERKHISGHASGFDCTRAKQECSKHQECEKTEHIAEDLVACAMPAYVDNRGAGGKRDGEQAVIALQMLRDERAVAVDLPCREVTQIEDEYFWLGEVELEMTRSDAA